MKIRAAQTVRGKVSLPGDKSISHRAAIFSALAAGTTRITNYASSEDCRSTVDCLAALGVTAEFSGSTLTVGGVGKNGLAASASPLDCGNSGTTMRLMAGVLAGQPFRSTLVGDASLQKRPMRRVADPLEQMGAAIASTDGRAPLTIDGKQPLASIEYRLPVASAQIKSCILLAGLNARGRTTVIEPVPTRDHTERMLRWFGVDVTREERPDGAAISVSGDAELAARDLNIPSDISSAAFLIAAAAGLAGSELEIANVGLNPTRTAVLEAFRGLGARIEIADMTDSSNEPAGTIRVTGGLSDNGRGVLGLSGATIANLIDEVPILAVLGSQSAAGIEIREAGELRHKESDRIKAVADNLRRMNADVEEFPDGLRVGRSDLKGAVIDSCGDHRIAMAFAIAALFAEGETEIEGASASAVSFPDFFEVLGSITA